jgi:hypothetical protein
MSNLTKSILNIENRGLQKKSQEVKLDFKIKLAKVKCKPAINKSCLICLFSKKACLFIKVGYDVFKNTNIEQVIVIQLSSYFQSSYHWILLNLSLFINQVILSLFLLTAYVNNEYCEI